MKKSARSMQQKESVRPQSPVVRSKSTKSQRPHDRINRAGAETRTKILDAAELLFADLSYEGTALRDVSEAAKANIALSIYYFGTKQNLFNAVVARRGAEIEATRMATLATIAPTLSAEETIRALVRGYVAPFVEARFSRDPQWVAYANLVPALVNVRRWIPLTTKLFDKAFRAYIDRFRNALPEARHNDILNSFRYMLGAMVYVCSRSDRFAKDIDPKPASRQQEMELAMDSLVEYSVGGFLFCATKRRPTKSKAARETVEQV